MGRSRGCCVSGAGGAVAEGTVGADLVVLPPPALDEDLGFQQGVEALAIEARVAPRAVERFHSAVLPRTARFDEEGRDPDPVQPVPHRGGGARRAVVGPQKRRRPALDEQLGQPRQDVVAAQSAGDVETQALAGVRIHDGEDPHRAPIGGAVEDEVVGPDVGRPLGPPPHQRAGREPEAAPFGVLPGDPQAFLTPEPRDPLVVHPPALLAQQGRDATGAVAAEAGGQRDDARDQRRLIRGRPGHVALCRPRLAGDLAGPPLRHRVLVRAGGCRPAPLGRAQKFPAATSRNIALASA